MRRMKANYHALQVLKNARPKLRKAIVSNCNKDLLNSICDCVLNVLNGNIRSLPTLACRQTSAARVSETRNTTTMRLPATAIVRGVARPCRSAVPTGCEEAIMTLSKMYLVPAAAYDARRPHSQPPPQPKPVKTKRATKRSGRTASQHPHDKWVALRTKLLEADVTEADLMHRFVDFLRKLLPQASPRRPGNVSPRSSSALR